METGIGSRWQEIFAAALAFTHYFDYRAPTPFACPRFRISVEIRWFVPEQVSFPPTIKASPARPDPSASISGSVITENPFLYPEIASANFTLCTLHLLRISVKKLWLNFNQYP
jgi:hypothetical protein